MTQWPIQRNVYTLVPMNNQPEATHVLTTHNTNTSRISTTTNLSQPSSSTGSNIYDDSLTNLSWLHDINILKRTIPTINSSSSTSSSTNNSGNPSISTKRKDQILSNTSISSCSSLVNDVHPNDIDDNTDLTINNDDDDQWKMYKTNPEAKPVYSYSQLILLAMRQSGHDKMTLQMIYEWVADNFPYFKKMESTWQNSIRHNLSLNKCFIKVPRTKKDAGGKGGFWKLSSDYERQRSKNKSNQQINSTSTKRTHASKRSTNSSRIAEINNVIKSEAWIDPILPCIVSKNQSSLHCHTTTGDRPSSYIRMPSSFLSPISSPDSLTVPSFYQQQQQQQINDFSSVSNPSPSSSPSSMSSAISKQNILSTKLDDTDMLLLDSSTFDWDAYLYETANDIDGQPLLSTRTEQDLFNDFNAALTDLTSSAEAAAGGDPNAFDGFDYPIKHSTFNSLFVDDDEPQQSLAVKGRGIKRPSWWLTHESITPTKLPSLETAFDLKLSK